jgi:hypothetical protein
MAEDRKRWKGRCVKSEKMLLSGVDVTYIFVSDKRMDRKMDKKVDRTRQDQRRMQSCHDRPGS